MQLLGGGLWADEALQVARRRRIGLLVLAVDDDARRLLLAATPDDPRVRQVTSWLRFHEDLLRLPAEVVADLHVWAVPTDAAVRWVEALTAGFDRAAADERYTVGRAAARWVFAGRG